MLRYNKLKNLGLCDAYIITSDINRYYISGFKSSYGYALQCGKQNYYVTDFRYSEEAADHFKGENVTLIAGSSKENEIKIAEIFNDNKIKTIGYEDNRISCYALTNLQNLITNKQFVPCGKEIEKLRFVKDDYEISQIEAAQKITDKAFNKILNYIKAGVSERDIKTELEYQLFTNGADDLAFDTIVASGSNSSKPHSGVSLRKVNSGEFIVIDFGAKYNGYCSDMTRTVAVGKPNSEMVNIYNAVLKAQNLAINALKAKLSCKEIFMVAKEYLQANGYGNNFLHGLGHGLGLEIHEGPSINSESTEVFEKNSVVTIEPGVYLEKAFGVRIEDLVIVKDTGIKNITLSNKELIIL